MTKMKLLTFFLALLISGTLLSTCKAQSEQVSVKFTGIASGECLLLIGAVLGPQPPQAAFIGRGTIAITGSAMASALYTYYYTADGAKALGLISARWDSQMIIVCLKSKGEACGFFVDEGPWKDLFTVGLLPGGPMTPSLSYEGTYKDSTGTHKISGKAGVLAMMIGNPGSEILAIGAMLLKPDGSPLLSIVWVYVDLPLGQPLGTLHAANLFMHSVKVKMP
jgi:hypothetical protein